MGDNIQKKIARSVTITALLPAILVIQHSKENSKTIVNIVSGNILKLYLYNIQKKIASAEIVAGDPDSVLSENNIQKKIASC